MNVKYRLRISETNSCSVSLVQVSVAHSDCPEEGVWVQQSFAH